MVDLPSQPLGDIDPEFQKIALETGGLTYGLSGTTTREKLLLNLANDVCREHFGLAFRLHVQAALSHGVPFSDVLGVVRFIGPYAGYPAAADALERLGAVAAELGIDVRSAVAEPSVDNSSGHLTSGCDPRKISRLRMSGWPASSRRGPAELGRCQG
jgi:4-carboxymuconolactone decarboxylase